MANPNIGFRNSSDVLYENIYIVGCFPGEKWQILKNKFLKNKFWKINFEKLISGLEISDIGSFFEKSGHCV